MRRVRDFLCAGDHVVIATGYVPQTPDSIYLVRHGDSLVLSRIALKSGLILLLPPSGDTDVKVVEAQDPSSVLVGRVVLIVRRCTLALTNGRSFFLERPLRSIIGPLLSLTT